MHVHFSYQHVSHNLQIDKAIRQYVAKLERLLHRFSNDLIRLHGLLEYNAAHQGPSCSLNLWLPTAQLHARHEGGPPLTALQVCFNHLVAQVKKHKQVLRREDVWKRRRYKFQQEARELAAGEVRIRDRQQLRDYLDQVLPQLERFITRELRYREMGGILPPGTTLPAELVNEVVARVLEYSPRNDSNSDAAPFHLLVSEAIRVLNGPLAGPAQSSPESLESAREQEILAVANSAAAAAEPVRPPDPADLLLSSLPVLHRQVYTLHVLEGFDWEETGRVLGVAPREAEELFQQVNLKVAAVLQQGQVASESKGGEMSAAR
ncbi:MAG: hypothetical protein A3H27_16140 [Acidobacteria bacterium RIFCSPLOWO2_02_FULL_59_13]|nr:MAG: hypothetical protein A3H27_16140 [Acidobacteria bacterium RIFCSPLOWO2_02_FULL_59_13]